MLLQRHLEAKVTQSLFVHVSTTIWLQLPINSESSWCDAGLTLNTRFQISLKSIAVFLKYVAE